jgi:hypothetical protein
LQATGIRRVSGRVADLQEGAGEQRFLAVNKEVQEAVLSQRAHWFPGTITVTVPFNRPA